MMEAERRRRYRDSLLNRHGHRPLNWKPPLEAVFSSDRYQEFQAVPASLCTLFVLQIAEA